MSDQPPSDQPRKRPILKLKNPPAALVPPPPPPPVVRWKCKPCGTTVPLTGEEAPADIIRCPACNARLGTAQDFADNSPKVRARRIEGAA
jgi:DNA-directed RNA polymerase subunit RPC12/RpoP